jgi:hypothetical protein
MALARDQDDAGLADPEQRGQQAPGLVVRPAFGWRGGHSQLQAATGYLADHQGTGSGLDADGQMEHVASPLATADELAFWYELRRAGQVD